MLTGYGAVVLAHGGRRYLTGPLDQLEGHVPGGRCELPVAFALVGGMWHILSI